MMAFESAGALWIVGAPAALGLPRNREDMARLASSGLYDLWLSPETIAKLKCDYEPLPDRPFVHDLESTSWPIHRPHEPLTAKPFIALEETLTALKCRAAGLTPGWRGLTLLKRWQKKHPERFTIDVEELPGIPQDHAPNVTKPVMWERGIRYVHKLDMNAAYLAAAKGVPLGAGSPQYTTSLLWQPGAYRVRRHPLVNDFAPVEHDGWYDTSTLRVAYEMGQQFDVLEGYVWSRQSTALRGWAELLGNALDAVPQGKPYIKAIYTRTMGKIGSSAGSNALWYRHPHWWRAVVALAGMRVWWLTLKVPEIYGIATDSIIVVTTGTAELPAAIRARLGDKPGKYRHEWTKILPAPVARLFGQVPATKLLDELARYPTVERVAS